MTKENEKLVDAVLVEIERVWGGLSPVERHFMGLPPQEDQPYFEGGEENYQWLERHSGIIEEEDVMWQLVMEDRFDVLSIDEDEEDEQETMEFLRDDEAVNSFLKEFLQKYKSIKGQYPDQ